MNFCMSIIIIITCSYKVIQLQAKQTVIFLSFYWSAAHFTQYIISNKNDFHGYKSNIISVLLVYLNFHIISGGKLIQGSIYKL